MTKYSGLLKAKLQELLTARGLPVDGTKEVLIERLEESDKVAAELDEFEEDDASGNANAANPVNSAAAPAVASVSEAKEEQIAETSVSNEGKAVEATTSAAEAEAVATTSAETAVVEETKKEITPEELKALAIEHLKTKIQRALKFSEDETAKSLEADLTRIEKFGVSLESSIAKELGYGKKPAKTAFVKRNFNKKRPFQKFGNRKNSNNSNNRNINMNRNRNGNNGHRSNYGNGRVYKTR